MLLKRWDEIKELLINSSFSLLDQKVDCDQAIHFFHQCLVKIKNAKSKVYVIGNGGSAGIASHFSVDLINALKIPSLTLYDSNVMTCISNDYGYDQVFSHPLCLYLQPTDLLVAISSSGSSQNILNAAKVAKKNKASLITLSGFHEDNPLRKMGDLNIWLNSCDYGLVESAHFFFLHTIIDSWKLVKEISYA